MDNRMNKKRMKIQLFCVFMVTLSIILACGHYLGSNNKKSEQMKVRYTARMTVSRIESRLDKYLERADFIKNIIEEKYDFDDKKFSQTAALLYDKNDVIEAIELAKDGIVGNIYPLKGNEPAMGLNMLTNPKRKKEAKIAEKTGQYTIAGPYELKQGGIGALLFDPVYISENGEKKFWGFVILVIDWDKFIDEINLSNLEDAGYDYQIWKKNLSEGTEVTIAEGNSKNIKSPLEVVCAVPNDTWYFEIAPKAGWITKMQLFIGTLVAVSVLIIVYSAFWQYFVRRYKDAVYAENIKKAAKEAQIANETKTRFLFNMSHDIRTPMNAIVGFSELLEKHLDDKERAADYVAKIKKSSSFLLSLINYVLEMARIESGKVELKSEITDIKVLIDSLNAVFESDIKNKNLKYTCKCNIEHGYIICDLTKVKEIYLNIISNAIKYTNPGGSVNVEFREIPCDREGYATYVSKVEDTGIGMSKEYLPHIFEEFSREHTSTETKIAGTGLGLPIVKSLVELMGGTIDVESKVNVGTTMIVTLTFPIAMKEQAEKQRKEVTNRIIQNVKGKNILIAEDNELNAEIAMTVLKENGIQAECVADGKACVENLAQKPEDYYDAILMDIQMPNMNGYEAAKKIRSMDGRRSKIPIIAMTANAFEEDKQRAIESGMNAHIGKPIDIKKLVLLLGSIFDD